MRFMNGFRLPRLVWGNSPSSLTPDPIAFLEFVRRGAVPVDYKVREQHSDFMRAFEGPSGQRVLFQIFDWGGVFATAGSASNEQLQRLEGRRELCWAIMAALKAEVPALIGPHPSEEIKQESGDG